MNDYWIMSTDYDHYSYVYGCGILNANGTCNTWHAWIWSRTRELTGTPLEDARAAVRETCIELEDIPEAVLVRCK